MLPLPSEDGKITAAQISGSMGGTHSTMAVSRHMVQPGMVYISQPTERWCFIFQKSFRKSATYAAGQGLYLFVDGARCGYGLMAEGNDVMLPDLATFADVFTSVSTR